MASGLIDVIATISLLIALVVGLAIAAAQTDEALVQVAILAAIIVSFLVFPTAMETLTRGKTLGKMALGLRTVRDDAGPISFQHAFVRALIGVVEIYAFFGGPAFFSALLSSRGKRLGDYAAGTYVVRERVRLQLAQPTPMPPQLAHWAASAPTWRRCRPGSHSPYASSSAGSPRSIPRRGRPSAAGSPPPSASTSHPRRRPARRRRPSWRR